jgi:hypothetical protein
MLRNWLSTCKRMKLYPYFTVYAKINSKEINYLNAIRAKTKKKTKVNSFMTLIMAMK